MLKLKRIFLGFCICLIAILPPGCSHQTTASGSAAEKNEKVSSDKTVAAEEEIVSVNIDELLSHPQKYYEKPIRVEGIVAKVESKLVFRLGCEDACLSMPVESEVVKPEQEVVVEGKITKQKSGKFVFRAQKVTSE